MLLGMTVQRTEERKHGTRSARLIMIRIERFDVIKDGQEHQIHRSGRGTRH